MAFAQANQGFRAAYAQAKKDALANIGPVIVAAGEDVYLIHNGTREKVPTISRQYSVLKIVDHIPLALFCLLEKRADKPLDAYARATLKSMLELSRAAGVDELDYSPATKARLSTMLAGSISFMEKTLADDTVSRAQLDGFVQAMRQGTFDNVDDAVALELGAIDSAVQVWRAKLTPAEWKQLHVVVADGHMPREAERRMQYFAKLLNQKREGARLIYMEGSSDVDAAIDLLAIHVVDEAISREYFKGDAWRMHRDLLSDAASRFLRLHPPLSSR